ncbi:MAG TPA: hypothetical protein PKW90_21450 [Myxococcota bacterium]|nr:hypothetical protein [Myxococcota bacterium]
MTGIHKLGLATGLFLVGLVWFVYFSKPGLGLEGPVFVTVLCGGFGVVLAILERRGIGKPPDRRNPRPAEWVPSEPIPSPLVGPRAWATARYGEVNPPARGSDLSPAAVEEELRATAPVATGLVLPEIPEMDDEDLGRAIDALPDVCTTWNPIHWPVCCRRPAVIWLVDPIASELAALEALTGRLDGLDENPSWPEELADIRRGLLPESGVNLFVCSACRRVYAAYSYS